MKKALPTNIVRLTALALAGALALPNPALALRAPERTEAKSGLEEIEKALKNSTDPLRAAATVLARQAAAGLEELKLLLPIPFSAEMSPDQLTMHPERSVLFTSSSKSITGPIDGPPFEIKRYSHHMAAYEVPHEFTTELKPVALPTEITKRPQNSS